MDYLEKIKNVYEEMEKNFKTYSRKERNEENNEVGVILYG